MKVSLSTLSNYSSLIQQKKVTKPNEGVALSRVVLIDQFNDYSINFQAKQTITAKIKVDRGKLLKNLSDILATNVPKLTEEQKANVLLRKAMAFAKATRKKLDELNFQAEAISQNPYLSSKQKYDALGKMDKEVKRLEKLKMPKEVAPPKASERFDYSLINKFKISIMNENYDLKTVFLNHYKELENVKTVEELKKKFPHIKVPVKPIDVVAKKCLEVLDRDFYKRLNEEFEKDSSNENIVDFLAANITDLLNIVLKKAYITNQETSYKLLTNVCEHILLNYEKLLFDKGFTTIPEIRKQKEPNITLADSIMLNLDYDDFVLKVLRQQYLEGKKLNEISYDNGEVNLLASELKDSEYKFDKSSEKIKKIIADAQKLQFLQRDYKNFTNEELFERLSFYANSELANIEEIFDIILDFDVCKKTPEDMRYLVKFIRELDLIIDSRSDITKVVDSIRNKDLRPHGTYKLNEAERLKIEEKRRFEHQESIKLVKIKKEFDDAILSLYENELAQAVDVCSKYYPETCDEKSLQDSQKIVSIIKKAIAEKNTAQQLEMELLRWELYNEHLDKKSIFYKLATEYAKNFNLENQESRIGQYLWNLEIISNYPKSLEHFPDPELLTQIVEKFDNDKDMITKLLCKYEDYKLLAKSERNSIKKLLEMFNYKDVKTKFMLKYIVENEYVNSDTIFYSESNIKNTARTFASSAKKQIMDKYRFPLCLDFFKAFEDALPLDAKAQGSAGVKKTGRNNEKLEHKMEVKILAYDDRLFSSRNNYYFDIFSDVGLH